MKFFIDEIAKLDELYLGGFDNRSARNLISKLRRKGQYSLPLGVDGTDELNFAPTSRETSISGQKSRHQEQDIQIR